MRERTTGHSIHFSFETGVNPFISFNNYITFDMLVKYDYEQESAQAFKLYDRTPKRTPKTYAEKKEALRSIAQLWQADFSSIIYYQSDLVMWCGFFEELGKRYGLIKEFKENGII